MNLTLLIALVVGLAVGLYFWFGFGPDIEPHRVYRAPDYAGRAKGWEVLRPWAAWPIVAVYSAPVFILAGGLGWLMGRGFMADERRRLDRHSKEATDRMREANRLMEEAKQARQRDQAIASNVKRDSVQLSRQAGRDNSQRVSAVGELKRRREREDKLRQQLAAANREIERLQHLLPPESGTQ